MTRLLRAGLLMAIAGAVWSAWPSPAIDRTFGPHVAERTFGRRNAPRALIDDAHFNAHTVDGHLSALAVLLARDGYRVDTFSAPFSARSLLGCDVLLIVDPLGLRGQLQRAVNALGFGGLIDLHVRAFAPREVRAIETWVRRGGRLLLVADDALAGEAASDLASAFGVGLRGWWTEDVDARTSIVHLEHGAGRVVMLGEAREGTDHPQFVLDLMHWLSGTLDE
jgi:hypothetical protein